MFRLIFLSNFWNIEKPNGASNSVGQFIQQYNNIMDMVFMYTIPIVGGIITVFAVTMLIVSAVKMFQDPEKGSDQFKKRLKYTIIGLIGILVIALGLPAIIKVVIANSVKPSKTNSYNNAVVLNQTNTYEAKDFTYFLK